MAVAISAQELLASNPTVYAAFAQYGQGKFPNIDNVIAKLGYAVWRDFQRSAPARACGVDLSAYAVSKPTVAVPARAHEPTREELPQTAAPHHTPPAPILTVTCAACQETVPKTWMREGYCLNCKKHGLDSVATPAQPVANAGEPGTAVCDTCHCTLPIAWMRGTTCKNCAHTAVPVVKPTEPAISTAEHGLLGMIAAGLKEMGFAPDKAVSAQRCEEIAFEQASAVVEMVLEDLEKQGKLGTKRTIIEVREPRKPVQQLEGAVPVWFPRLVKLARCRVSAFLVGPAGSGKTTAFKMLAQQMGLPFHRVSLAAGTDEGQLQGWLHPSREGMKFEYVPSVVSYGYEHGGVVLLDDIDLGDANMLGIANAAFDQAGWHIPLRHDNPVFIKHPDFYMGAAANTAGHGADRSYVGANQLDERTLSRLRAGQIRCDYDPTLETQLYGNHKDGAEESLAFGHRLRARLRAQGAGQLRDVSTRDIETRWIMLDQFTVGEAWYGQFCDWSEDECQRVHAIVDHNAMTVELE